MNVNIHRPYVPENDERNFFGDLYESTMTHLIYDLTNQLFKAGNFKCISKGNLNTLRFFYDNDTLEILIPQSRTGYDGLWISDTVNELWQRIAVLLHHALKRNEKVEADNL